MERTLRQFAVVALGLMACGKDPASKVAVLPPNEAVRQCLIIEGSPEYRPFLKCLVDRYHWTPDSALGFVADTVRVIETLRAQKRKQDEDRLAAEAAQAQRLQDELDSAQAARQLIAWRRNEEARLSGIWVSSDSTGLYYRGSCAEAKKIKGADRREWTVMEPTGSGFRHSTAPGC
jgi:hypothetical protein